MFRRQSTAGSLLAAAIFLPIIAIYMVFFASYESITCIGSYCNLYKQTGMFGRKHLYDKFKRDDVVNFVIYETRHTSGSTRHRRTHTDYRPVLIMKDGSRYSLPFKFCKEYSEAFDMGTKIRSNKYFKKSNSLW